MAINYLQYSPSYQATVKAPVRERQAAVARHLDDNYLPLEERYRIIALVQNEIGIRRGLHEHGFYGDFRLFRTAYEQYLVVDEEQKERIIAEAHADHDRDHSQEERDPILHVVWCLSRDGIRTKEDIKRLHVEDGKSPASPPPPEPDVPVDTPQQTTDTNPMRRPLDVIVGAIQDIADVEERHYRDIEELREEYADLKKYLDVDDKEIRSLKQKFGGHEQRIAELEDLLTTDPAQLAAVRATTQRLKRDVTIGLPTHTAVGDYWKEEYATVYRRNLRRFLNHKGTQPSERNHITDAIRQVTADPFYNSLGTEVRCNGEDGLTISGIEPGETYYYSHADPWLRLTWVVRENEKRVHFVDAFRKATIAHDS